MAAARRYGGNRGLTLLECMVTAAVLLIVAAAAVPTARFFVKRQKEVELRAKLRDLRGAIEAYHWAAANGLVQVRGVGNKEHPYPESLQVLVEGVPGSGAWSNPSPIKFLRRIPRDPFTPPGDECDEGGWRLRSTNTKEGFTMWDRSNVFDVRSCSEGRALDGSYYRDW